MRKLEMKQQQPIDNLADLERHIASIRSAIATKEERLATLWHSLSQDDPKRAKQRHSASFIQRGIAFAADSAEVVDGVVFGWRMYRRLSGMFSVFGRRKTKGKGKR